MCGALSFQANDVKSVKIGLEDVSAMAIYQPEDERKLSTHVENHNDYVSEEVGHGHITYVCKRIYAVSLWWFMY